MKMVYSENLNDFICHGEKPFISVTHVAARPDYTMLLTFSNGERRIYNALPLLQKPLYAPLRNVAFFLTAKADGLSVAWNDELDIAPEHLYECGKPLDEDA